MDKISNIFSKILPIYWAFLTYMLLRPGTENREYWFMFPGIDKVLHVSIFAMLGFCFAAAYPRTKFLIFMYIMLLYAFVTEILQDAMQLGRGAESWDIAADIAGVLIGFLVYKKTNNSFFS